MGEINAGEEENKDSAAENGAEDQDESQNDGGSEGEDEGADNSEDENAEDKTDSDEADEGKEGKTDKSKSKPTPKADEPQVRKRNVDFILERKNRKIEKLQSKGKDDDADQGEEEDDLADEDAKVIDRRVGKILSPFIAKQMADEDKQEIADFVTTNPDFKPYAERVAKYAQHESRKNMPIKAIFYEVAGDDLLKIGAERAKKADKEAKHSQAGGGDNRGGDAPKDVWSLTPQEFAAEQEKIRHKRQ